MDIIFNTVERHGGRVSVDRLRQELGVVEEGEAREAVQFWIRFGVMEYVEGEIRMKAEPIPNGEDVCNAVYNKPRSDRGRARKGKGRLVLQ